MIGFYDYTVWLTYLSFISACTGIFLTLTNNNPIQGIICLLVSGLCDAFDGKVASTKKDRTEMGKKFGIQIDSLSDVVAFGILPAVIGIGSFRTFQAAGSNPATKGQLFLSVVAFIITIMYMLAAYIRLAYYNVTEEERQKTETGRRTTYSGLPVTSAALVYPILCLLQNISEEIFITAYFAAMLLMSFLFLLNIPIKKPGFKGVLVMTGIGAIELIVLILFRIILK